MGPPPQTISGLGKKEEKAGMKGPGNKKETNKTRRTFMAQLQASRKISPGQIVTYCWPSIPFFHLPSVPKYGAAVEATRLTSKKSISRLSGFGNHGFFLAIVLLNKKESSPKVHFWGEEQQFPLSVKKPRFFCTVRPLCSLSFLTSTTCCSIYGLLECVCLLGGVLAGSVSLPLAYAPSSSSHFLLR